jgi:imidazolonepropionase-like amidohydrolase
MLAGSDTAVIANWCIPAYSLHQEFALLAASGLSPLKILQMTTLNGA